MNRRSATRRRAPEHASKSIVTSQISVDAKSSNRTAGHLADRLSPGRLDSLRCNRPLIAGVMAACVVLGVLAIFTPRFETNDDAGMNAIAAGQLYVDHPDEHLFFSNVLIGLALKGLYGAAPDVSWYGGYLFVTASLSLAAVAYVCLRRDFSTFDVCLTAVSCVWRALRF